MGTYWYHSHQVSHEQVIGGLFGGVVFDPVNASVGGADVDVTAMVHIYDGTRTVNGLEGDVPTEVASGAVVRVRVVNTDNGPMSVWTSGSPYRVLAVDGYDVNEPDVVDGAAITVTAGGRADLEIEVPASGARLELGGNTALLLGEGAASVSEEPAPREFVDLLSYGSPAPLWCRPRRRGPAVRVRRRPASGLPRRNPGLWWTVNGNLYPDVPMFTVSEGDVVTMRIENKSGTCTRCTCTAITRSCSLATVTLPPAAHGGSTR